MTFLYINYLPLMVLLILITITVLVKNESRFFQWVKDHWFFRRTKLNKLSALFYYLGITALMMATLDLRGPEERVVSKSQSQKTIILIDGSASMLAEDVRPSRFSKSLLLAKHFVKSAIGHEISVIVFSDNAKRIVPFTKDIDLIDARLSALEDLQLINGGTGLTLALKEALQFLKIEDSVDGNIVIFTDGEETSSKVELTIPPGVAVAIVGIGTSKGGVIPQRTKQGLFIGNKKHNGAEVVTKLNEVYFKELGGQIKKYKYWIASSYSLPTQDILKFFSEGKKGDEGEDTHRIRPVLGTYLLIPGFVLLLFSFLLRFSKTYIFLSLMICVPYIGAAENEDGQKKEKEKTPYILELEGQLKQNKLNLNGKRKLAQELLKNENFKEAEILYKEYLSDEVTAENQLEKFNQASAMLQNKNLKEGLKLSQELYNKLENPKTEDEKQLLDIVKKNIVTALKQMSSQQQSGGKGESDEKNDENEDKKDNNENKDQDKKNQKQNKPDKGDDKNKNDNKDKDKDEQKPDNSELENQKKQGAGGKVKKEKMPAILKQLMSDDSQLQKKLIDADTVERKNSEAKDW